jgi:hypothetical protein
MRCRTLSNFLVAPGAGKAKAGGESGERKAHVSPGSVLPLAP